MGPRRVSACLLVVLSVSLSAQFGPVKKLGSKIKESVPLEVKKKSDDGQSKDAPQQTTSPSGTTTTSGLPTKRDVEKNKAVDLAVSLSSSAAFEKAKAFLVKLPGVTIQQANADAGQVVGMNAYHKGTKDHETRYVLSVITEGANVLIRISVFDKSRRNIIQPDRWGGEEFDADLTLSTANQLRSALQ